MATLSIAKDMVKFINKSWTPFHAVDESGKMLSQSRFQHLSEKDAWKLTPGGK